MPPSSTGCTPPSRLPASRWWPSGTRSATAGSSGPVPPSTAGRSRPGSPTANLEGNESGPSGASRMSSRTRPTTPPSTDDVVHHLHDGELLSGRDGIKAVGARVTGVATDIRVTVTVTVADGLVVVDRSSWHSRRQPPADSPGREPHLPAARRPYLRALAGRRAQLLSDHLHQ
jgi:hypothetical protein